MQTQVLTPTDIFYMPQRLTVPLFQRAYVWNRDEQWSLLWEDIRELTERRLANPMNADQHFLGAVVLQEQSKPAGQLQERTIIDGQQRLTTLQLILDAAHAVLTDLGQTKSASQLQRLTFNPEDFCKEPEDRFKVWPTNRDRAPYNAVMDSVLPIDHVAVGFPESRLVQGHAYFAAVIAEWIQSEGVEAIGDRCDELAVVLMKGLQLVVIGLKEDEDSQEIFETLNARGTPLSSADLIKNFVFHRLGLEPEQAETYYRDYWQLFESKFWESEVSAGRFLMPRSSLFLTQWLLSKTSKEISPRATFSRFKAFVDGEAERSVAELLPELHDQARTYQKWVVRAADPHAQLSTVELFVYRTQALESEVGKPLLLWLHDPNRPRVPDSEIESAIASVESWLVRRSLLRLSSSDLGRVVADLLTSLNGADPSRAGEIVSKHLSRQDRAGTYWPVDDEIRESLRGLLAYRRFKRPRLRMLLEAAEDYLRSYTKAGESPTGSRVVRGQFHIEHLMPQQWQTHWAVSDPVDEANRQEHVHQLGNLTLLTRSLNTAVSNGPWLGPKGKLSKLDEHDVFLLNRRVRQMGANGWDEDLIDSRTEELIDSFLETWPVPEGHEGTLREERQQETTWIEINHLIDAKLMEAGTKLIPRYGGTELTGTVVAGGWIQVGDEVFASPSGAARYVRQGSQTNGWTFWRTENGDRLEDIRARFRRGSGDEVGTIPAPSLPVPSDVDDRTEAASYLVIWNPKKWDWLDRDDLVKAAMAGGKPNMAWSFGVRKSGVRPGMDRAYLVRLGEEPKGIIGSGTIMSHPHPMDHWDDEASAAGNFVDVAWDQLVGDDDILPVTELEAEFPDFAWLPQAGGKILPKGVEDGLLCLWRNHVGDA